MTRFLTERFIGMLLGLSVLSVGTFLAVVFVGAGVLLGYRLLAWMFGLPTV